VGMMLKAVFVVISRGQDGFRGLIMRV
jgi:hypothetical protein